MNEKVFKKGCQGSSDDSKKLLKIPMHEKIKKINSRQIYFVIIE